MRHRPTTPPRSAARRAAAAAATAAALAAAATLSGAAAAAPVVAPLADPAASGPASRPAYREPDFSDVLFRPDEQSAAPATRARAAAVMARYVARELRPDRPGDATAAARWLGVALRLDRESSDALVCNGLLRRGRPPAVLADAGPWEPAAAVAELTRIAAGWRAGRPGDRRAAAYVLALLAERAPADPGVAAEVRGLAAAVGPAEDRPLAWGWAGDGGAVRIASPPPGGLFAAPVAYADAGAAAEPVVRVERADGSPARITRVTFAADPSKLFWADVDSGVRLWDPVAGAEVRRFDHPNANVAAMQATADGATLMTAAGPAVRLWDVATGRERRALAPAGKATGSAADDDYDAALSPDGRYLLASTHHKPAVLWDLPAAGDAPAFELPRIAGRQLSGVWFAADGAAFGCVEDGKAVVRRMSDRQVLGRVALAKGNQPTLALLAGGTRAVVDRAGDGLVMVDVAGDTEVRRFVVPKKLPSVGSQALAVLPGGRHLAQLVYSSDFIGVHLWDVETGARAAAYPRPGGPFRTMGVSRDGRRMAVFGFTGCG